MVELLAIPGWQAPVRTVEDWLNALAVLGHAARISLDEDHDTWIEVPDLSLRGLTVLDGVNLEAIHFELENPETEVVLEVLCQAAAVLSWELHPDDDDDDDDDDEIENQDDNT